MGVVLTKIEQVFDVEYAQTIENEMLSKEFPWYYFSDVDYSNIDSDKNNFGFVHTFLNSNKKILSKWSEIVMPLPYILADSINVKLSSILSIRAVMLTSVGCDYQHMRHTDIKTHENTYTAIYYVNDSDGFTSVYDKEQVTKFMPKKNSAIVFDSKTEHHASKPINNSARVVINCNFVGVTL